MLSSAGAAADGGTLSLERGIVYPSTGLPKVITSYFKKSPVVDRLLSRTRTLRVVGIAVERDGAQGGAADASIAFSSLVLEAFVAFC